MIGLSINGVTPNSWMVYFMENPSINGCWLGVPWKQPCPIYWLVNGSGKNYGLSSPSRINHGNPVMAHVYIYIHRSFTSFKIHGFSLAMFIAVPDCSLPTPSIHPQVSLHCSDRIRAWYLLLVSLSKHGIPKQWENIGKYGHWVVIEVTYRYTIWLFNIAMENHHF